MACNTSLLKNSVILVQSSTQGRIYGKVLPLSWQPNRNFPWSGKERVKWELLFHWKPRMCLHGAALWPLEAFPALPFLSLFLPTIVRLCGIASVSWSVLICPALPGQGERRLSCGNVVPILFNFATSSSRNSAVLFVK